MNIVQVDYLDMFSVRNVVGGSKSLLGLWEQLSL